MSEENEVPSDEQVARSIIYKDDFFKQYSEIVPEVGERLERYVFDIRDALSALRASWEKDIDKLRSDHTEYEKIINSEYAKVKALEAEKKGLEELIKNNQGNLDLERKGWTKTVQGLEERMRELEIGKISDKDEIVKMAEAICIQANENTRLKAENEKEGNSAVQQFIDHHHNPIVRQKNDEIDSLTLALAEAREILEEVESGLTRRLISGGMETTVAESTGMDETLNEVRKAISNPTAQRASEEMKGLREEVNEARSILNLLGFHYWPKQKEIDAYLEEMKGLRQEIADYRDMHEDHKRLVRELDVAVFGDGAAKQASLCDLVASIPGEVRGLRKMVPDLKRLMQMILDRPFLLVPQYKEKYPEYDSEIMNNHQTPYSGEIQIAKAAMKILEAYERGTV